MPAPTALKVAPAADIPLPQQDQNEEFLLDADAAAPELGLNDAPSIELVPISGDDGVTIVDEEGRPQFAPIKEGETRVSKESRIVPIPPHRMTPLKQEWPKIYPPLVEHLKLQVRVRRRAVEMRTSKFTTDTGALQKGADFVRAFALGFRTEDAIALLRIDNLWIESFEVKDVKTLNGDHLARCIGRLAGKDGRMKYAIENTSKTRVVLADSKIHILGEYKAIGIARESLVSLILGKSPSKVHGNLRTVAARMKERF